MKLKRLLITVLILCLAAVLPLTAHAAGQIALDVTGIESTHNYANNANQSWVLSYEGAESVSVTFDSRTALESNCDFLYLYDASGTQVGKYTGTALAGQTVTVSGSKITLRLTSDSSVAKWGFKVTSAYARVSTPVSVTVGGTDHGTLQLSPDTVYPGSTVTVTAIPDEGYYLKHILVNGEAIPGLSFSAAGDCVVTAEFTDDPAEVIADGSCGEGVTWSLTADGRLTVSGTGAMDSTDYGAAPWYPRRERITALTVGEGITSVPEGAFHGLSALERITIPFVGGSRKTAEDTEQYPLGYIFGTAGYEGGSSTYQSFHKTSPTANSSATYYIPTALRSVTVTGGSILDGAFYNCSRLTEIILPEGITAIGERAFYSCTTLTGVSIPESVLTVGASAFYSCKALTSVTLPANVTSIGNYAFNDCASMTEITLGRSVAEMGYTVFSGCSALQRIHVADGNTAYASEDGVLFSADMTSLLVYPIGKTGTQYSVPASVTSIGDSAFSGCKSLTGILLPEGLTAIGGSAFESCSSLASISIPDGVTELADRTFYNCPALTSVRLPETMTSLGSWTFHSCRELTSIRIPSGVKQIGEFTFNSCTKLASVSFPAGLFSIGQSAFENCDALTEPAFPASLSTIGRSAFYGCNGLTEVTLPANVGAIGMHAFSYCDNLRRINIPAKVSSIGEYTFRNCRLDEVLFEGSAPTINLYAFYGATANIHYPAGDESWKYYIVHRSMNGSLTWQPYSTAAITAEGTCGDGVYWTLDANGILVISGDGSMPDYSAGGAPWYRFRSSIKEAVIGGKVDYIGGNAFYGCSSLKLLRFELEWAPSFHDNALYGVRATARFYPESYNAGSRYLQDYGGSIVWEPVGESEEWLATGSIGYDTAWTLDYDGRLTVTGGSRIPDYSYGDAPWYPYASMVTSLVVEENIYDIGDRAFYGLNRLKTAYLFYWATNMEIGKEAFYGCSSLETLCLGSYVKIGSLAFENCTALSDIYIVDCGWLGSGYFSPAKDSFRNVTATVYYPRGVTCQMGGYGADTYGGNLTWTEADFGVCGVDLTWRFDETTGQLTVSGPGHFFPYRSGNVAPWGEMQTEVTSVYVEDGVALIPSYAFEYLGKAASIRLPDTLEVLWLNAFNDCSSLNDLLLPASLREICGSSNSGKPQFIRCPSLTDVYYLGTAEEWAQVENSGSVSFERTNGVIHFLELHKGTVTCTSAGTPDYYLFDDTSVYGSMYDLNKKPITSLPTVAALGHSYTDRASDRLAYAATCASPALYFVECDRCEQISASKTVPVGEKDDHRYTDYHSDANASCTADGTETASCDYGCGTKDTRTDEDSRLGHSFSTWETVVAPTYLDDGTKSRLCLRPGCDHTEEERIPATGPELVRNVGIIRDRESGTVILTDVPENLTVVLAIYRDGQLVHMELRHHPAAALSFVLPAGYSEAEGHIFFLTDSWIPIGPARLTDG